MLHGKGLHRHIQRDLEAVVPVWATNLGSQKNFFVQHILNIIYSDK